MATAPPVPEEATMPQQPRLPDPILGPSLWISCKPQNEDTYQRAEKLLERMRAEQSPHSLETRLARDLIYIRDSHAKLQQIVMNIPIVRAKRRREHQLKTSLCKATAQLKLK
jgi:hypothetical protein